MTNIKKQLIFMGPPASGKGTQTKMLAEKTGFPHIDTGSLLRSAIKNETELGLIAKGFIEKGQLAPAHLVASIIKERLTEKDCQNGYILDGYPRSVEQALLLDEILAEINENTETEGFCDDDNEALIQRKDDTEEIAKARFVTYYEQTEPLIDFYTKRGTLVHLDATGTTQEIFDKLLQLI